MYVCLCKGLTESEVRQAAQDIGAHPRALACALGLDDEDCCGRCARDIEELVDLARKPLCR